MNIKFILPIFFVVAFTGCEQKANPVLINKYLQIRSAQKEYSIPKTDRAYSIISAEMHKRGERPREVRLYKEATKILDSFKSINMLLDEAFMLRKNEEGVIDKMELGDLTSLKKLTWFTGVDWDVKSPNDQFLLELQLRQIIIDSVTQQLEVMLYPFVDQTLIYFDHDTLEVVELLPVEALKLPDGDFVPLSPTGEFRLKDPLPKSLNVIAEFDTVIVDLDSLHKN